MCSGAVISLMSGTVPDHTWETIEGNREHYSIPFDTMFARGSIRRKRYGVMICNIIVGTSLGKCQRGDQYEQLCQATFLGGLVHREGGGGGGGDGLITDQL